MAVGIASGFPVYEAMDDPRGICSSYYVHPRENKRWNYSTDGQEVDRFEIGGGHGIFGGDPLLLNFIKSQTPDKHCYIEIHNE